jgi:hypothetical protein
MGTCVFNHCFDQRQDDGETDVDCGGLCTGCGRGHGCMLDSDCLQDACDAVSLTCAPDHCFDHRQDADETDVDCGGADCVGCALGRKCLTGFDCAAGMCSPGNPHVCEP